MTTLEQIYSIYGKRPVFDTAFVPCLNAAMQQFGITKKEHICAFLAMVLGESMCFTHLSENMNYSSADRIYAVFRSHFNSPEAAKQYVNQPQKLANFVYAGLYGNGGVDSNDGWNYRGKGPCQLTFKGSYLNFFRYVGLPESTNPDYITTPKGGSDASAWFWKMNSCGTACDSGGFDAVYKKFQPSMVGLAEHKVYYTNAMEIL